MAWSLSTATILSQLRTAAGTTATDGTTTYTWKWKLEGPPLRWLDELTNYPLLILEPGDTEGTDHASRHQLDLPVTITAVIKSSTVRDTGAATADMYKMIRLVGEDMVGNIMDAGHRLNGSIVSNRVLRRCGVDYATTEAIQDKGLLAYSAEFVLTYFEAEP